MYYKVKAFLAFALQKHLTNLGHNNIFLQVGSLKETTPVHNNTESGTIVSIPLEHPKDREHGHFATPICFTFAKLLRANPKNLANELAQFLADQDKEYSKSLGFHNMFQAIQPLNGYLNFKLSADFLANELDNVLQNPESFAKGEKKDSSVLLEYVSANPTGPLHIGHARGAIFGSVLQRIGKQLGYNIISEYYVNDAGSQIDMLALSVYNCIALSLHIPQKNGEVYKGEYIEGVATKALEHFGRDYFINALQSEKHFNEISQELGSFAKNLMLEEIKKNLLALNIEFDHFVSEKELYSKWETTLKQLEKNGALLHKDGAIWLQSSLKGDEKDRVLVRENGMPTYMAGDIIYHKDKFERPYTHYINIWGADHHGYISRIKSSIDFLGFDSQKLEVLLAQMVSLLKGGQPYKMSKRAGNFILIQDVVNDIGADSLKFVFLSKSLDTHLEFDVNDLNKEDASNPVFYINYANARIHTLIEKSSYSNEEILHLSLKNLLLTEDKKLKEDTLQLILQSLGLFHILHQSYDERALQKLCEFLKNLAKSLHTFYNAHKILNTSHEGAILKVFLLVSLSLNTGFKMLGIEIKTKM